MRFARSRICAIGLLLLSTPVASQEPVEPRTDAAPDFLAFMREMPDCGAFRNACQMCTRGSDGKLSCTSVGIACSLGGAWRCSVPGMDGAAPK